MNKVYIIEGQTGEYDDASTWTVGVCLSESNAADLTKKLNEWLKKNKVHHDDQKHDNFSSNIENFPKIKKKMLKEKCLDPNISLDYTGAEYFWYEVDLLDDDNIKAFSK